MAHLAVESTEQEVEIRLRVKGVDIIHSTKYWYRRPLSLLPTTLVITYHRRSLAGGSAEWTHTWALRGRRALEFGALSASEARALHDFDFPEGEIPAWIAKAVDTFHLAVSDQLVTDLADRLARVRELVEEWDRSRTLPPGKVTQMRAVLGEGGEAR